MSGSSEMVFTLLPRWTEVKDVNTDHVWKHQTSISTTTTIIAIIVSPPPSKKKCEFVNYKF
jgi:hypothetical protein